MRPLNIVDLHCDTLMKLYLERSDLKSWQGHINLEKLVQGGSMVQSFAVFIPTGASMEKYGVTEDAYSYWCHVADLFDREMAANSDVIRPVRTVAQMEQNVKEGKLSALLTIEDSVALDGRIERVQEFYDRGARMMTLTWNYENCVGYPCSDDAEKHLLGLKPFGLEVIAKMDELGMVIDVSHLSEGGFWDIIRHGKKPFIASHSCCRALMDHRRNLTDEQLKALGDKGGVCGVNFFNNFLRPDGADSTVADVVRHMKYIADKAGIDAVALGSDFDGINDKLEFKDFVGMNRIVDGIADAFTADETDKICHGNALRVFREVIG